MPKMVTVGHCEGGSCLGEIIDEMRPENCTLVKWIKRCQKHSVDPNPIRVLLNEYMEVLKEDQ